MNYEIRNIGIAPKSIFRTAGLVLLLSILVARGFPAQVQAATPHFHPQLFGDATVTTFNGYQVVRTDSVCPPPYNPCTYGGINFNLPDTQSIPLSTLATLSTDFYALNGGTGGGSPRFVICLTPVAICGSNSPPP